MHFRSVICFSLQNKSLVITKKNPTMPRHFNQAGKMTRWLKMPIYQRHNKTLKISAKSIFLQNSTGWSSYELLRPKGRIKLQVIKDITEKKIEKII